ncbi:MAG: malto-oligosyltrehalose trehalohydrolase, partial [Solirubrobacteraceae bacterium]
VRERSRTTPLVEVGYGVWEGRTQARHGSDYRFVLDAERAGRRARPLADPCSRHQPRGLRGASRVFDTRLHRWSDSSFRLTPLAQAVLYELHVGTFTPAGTLDAAIGQLPRLAALGVAAVELMPVAEGPGERGWGYDGVYISATHHAYGGPAALQRFVDAAHGHGIGVILDVVYNHLGASGTKAIAAFGPYFTERYNTFWGDAINYDDEDCDPVREWVLQSAEGWILDFHLDGLRLDAVHAIFDQSATPILAEIAQRVHAANPAALVIAESGLNDPRVIRPRELGGLGCDAQWADDFHHSLRTLLTGEREGYYSDFGRVADLAKAYARPFVHDGGYSQFRKRRFGAPAADRPARQFVVFCQNHDQVGNRAFGDRLPRSAQALAALCLLFSPFTPMLFMGEEYGERAPFQFFTDHIDARIAKATREGRRREFAAFASFGEEVPDPQSPQTFSVSKLTRSVDPVLADLYAALIGERRSLIGEVDSIRFDEDARWLGACRGEHEMICNFGVQTQTIPTDRERVVLATGPECVLLRAGRLSLDRMSGALLR